MELGIQMGHGMQSLAGELLNRWGGGSVMLSPRNSRASSKKTPYDSLVSSAEKLRKEAGCIFVDPQLYSVKSPSKCLESFPHWKAYSGDLESNYKSVINALIGLNEDCEADAIVLPFNSVENIDDSWIELNSLIVEYARNRCPGLPLYVTIALKADALKSIYTIENLVSAIEQLNVDGAYTVCEHPGGAYLTDQSLWLLNYMQLVAGLKLCGKKVIAGFASHQMLLLALAKCDRVFSGNFLNVRRFCTSTFEANDDNGPSQRSKWYYAPQVLSEFKLTTLDLAHQIGVKEVLRTPFDDEYAEMLFGDAYPSNTAYREGNSFKHYLNAFHEQCKSLTRDSYEETLATYQLWLQTAESIIDGLRAKGIYDRDRNYANAFPASYQAVAAFDSQLGFQMRHEWANV